MRMISCHFLTCKAKSGRNKLECTNRQILCLNAIWTNMEFLFCHFHYCFSVLISLSSTEEWKARVVKELDALVTSCVVIPCSFTHPHGNVPTSKLRGIWYYSNNPDKHIYDEDVAEVVDNFKDRTKLLGGLGQNNCTLEITEIKDHDNGPFCLQIELVDTKTSQDDKHSFTKDCVGLKMLRTSPALNCFHFCQFSTAHLVINL